MPISTPAPIPSWANVTGKPTTIDGYSITDFDSKVLTNVISRGSGVVGSVAMVINGSTSDCPINSIMAGSWIYGNGVSVGFSGSWKNIGAGNSIANQGNMGLFLRVA